MRILVLLTDLFDTVGGIQTFNRALVKALDEIALKRGWNIKVLVLNDRGDNSLANEYTTRAISSYKGFSGSRARFSIAGILEGRKSDAVFFGHVNFSPLACAMKNRQKFLIVHGIDVWKKLPIFQLFGISHIQKILSVSSFTREQMSKNNNVDFDRFLIFPNTLDPFYGNGKLPQTRDNLALPNGRMILCVSRLDASERYKGIDKLIEALPDVLERIPEAFCVVVGNGSDRSRLEKLKKDLELTDKVIFTGWVSNGLLASYYRACDVFVLPSSQEGFGIVFLEAMYYAKPCVGVGAGAIPEIVENGKTGFVTKLGNVGSIADCLVHLLSNESLCESMGGAGKERLEQEYSFEKFRKRLEAILYS